MEAQEILSHILKRRSKYTFFPNYGINSAGCIETFSVPLGDGGNDGTENAGQLRARY